MHGQTTLKLYILKIRFFGDKPSLEIYRAQYKPYGERYYSTDGTEIPTNIVKFVPIFTPVRLYNRLRQQLIGKTKEKTWKKEAKMGR